MALQVHLAGYNIDSSLIKQLNTETATPEVISAAYARISRSSKSITELHEEALRELEKARRSNRNIIFELGHSSVAEHAVFNFDVTGVSRLLTETLESVRLASFTEKSQRYVTFSDDYIVPRELEAPVHAALRSAYIRFMDALFAEYQESYEDLILQIVRTEPDLPRQERECRAKEDARYILPLATQTQLGMTINARSLENLLRRLVSNPLLEAGDIYMALANAAKAICPSLVRYTEKEAFRGTFEPDILAVPDEDFADDELVRVIGLSNDPEETILSALLYEQTQGDYAHCREMVGALSYSGRHELWQQIFADIRPWHKMHRAFELVDATLELSMSESCWAQFKRHRMGTMIKQKDPSSAPYTLPAGIYGIGREREWAALLDQAEKMQYKLRKVSPELAAYARLNADKVKVLVKMNLRELYHFVRLRSDEHAQWEIRGLSDSILQYLKVLCPNATALLSGKSSFED